ncbi:MAG: heavy-metal-associated domain-containing protein [Flavobacteriaceae bacterium]|jgi:mercuric ion binding protein|tara:strand:- start:337 stop:714 length:378 start_codon:yes stop_codon:yes gene_type:complete
MKKSIFILTSVCFSLLSYAQESSSKNEKESIEVLGNCNMCKKRIEKAAFSVEGVKYATWDNSSGQLSLIYNGLKTDIDTIEKQIAAIGHDTEHHISTDIAYDGLPACCQYVRKGQEPKPGQITKH